jgi:hypothetical protein
MTYTAFNSAPQALSNISFNKIKHLASLPAIDPHLISIAALASRFIVEIEDAFTSIVNAPSNDGREVTVAQWFRCARKSPETFDGERVELDGAFNILISDTFNHIIDSIRDWHYKAARKSIGTVDIFYSRFDIELPNEIKIAVQALRLTDARREPLRDMLVASWRSNGVKH